jgi:hypothetical protein
MSYGKQQTLDRSAPQVPQQQSTALAKTEAAKLVGSYRDPSAVNTALANVAQRCHLLTPATNIGSLPEGCEIVLTAVTVDADRDCYTPKGSQECALKGTKLAEIGKALGVSWIPSECYRVDDGSSPYYCHYRVAGEYRAFDGQRVVITGEKQMDLRTGSATQLSLKDGELAMQRTHILSHAESKAKYRAIRSTGLRHAYTRAELEKPFVCARIMFTGRTEDPELRKLFAADISRSFMGGSQALYGESKQPARLPAGSPPPPVGAVSPDEDAAAIPTHGEEAPPASAPTSSGYTVNVQGKATPIESAPVEALQKAIAQCSADLADGVVPPDEVVGAREWRKAAMAQVAARGEY